MTDQELLKEKGITEETLENFEGSRGYPEEGDEHE